jgi:hypothetical protein
MGVLTLFFGRLAKLPSDGLGNPVFYFSALVPWNDFATALQSCSAVLADHQRVITKVFSPAASSSSSAGRAALPTASNSDPPLVQTSKELPRARIEAATMTRAEIEKTVEPISAHALLCSGKGVIRPDP